MLKAARGWQAILAVLGWIVMRTAFAAPIVSSSGSGDYECKVFEVHGVVLATDRHEVRSGDLFRINAKGETESALWEDLIGTSVPVISSGALSSVRFFVWFETSDGKVLSECDRAQ